MRLLISALLAVLLVSCAGDGARAQSSLTVVQTCGTLPLAYKPGAVRTGTQDVNGLACGTTTFTPSGTQAVSIASGAQASGSQPIGITPTDRTITSATGASQTVAAALATRKALLIVNTGNANCGINPTGGTAIIGGAGTLTLTPTGSYSPRIPSLAAITAICTAGQPLYAEES